MQEPYFTEATVNKEKGIIGQEITMYDDQPDWRLYFGTIENMYHTHPVKIDIAGTIASIDGITAEHLYTCYNTFYHPANMLLFVIGAVDPNEMMAFIRENQNNKEFPEPAPIQRFFDQEPVEVAIKERTLNMDVQKPKMYIGLKAKDTNLSGRDMLKHELSVQIALELIFGRTSSFYERVYDEGLIDETYAFDFTLEKGFGFAMIGSDSTEPIALEKAIKEELAKYDEEVQFESTDLERVKRKKIGFFLRALNSIEFIANQFTRYSFNEMNLFDVVPVLEELTIEDLKKAFTSVQGESQQTVFKILPTEKGTQ